MKTWGKRAVGPKVLVVMLALVVGLAVVGTAAGGVVQNSPADNQYGDEKPPAASAPEPEAQPEAKPDVFLPPTVASAGQEESDSGLLPFTGAALIVPSVLGGLLLAGGLFLVYRTRRREN